MAEKNSDSTYLVSADGDPVLIRVQGKANFSNCHTMKGFFRQMLDAGKTSFHLDLAECPSMDSTFLGTLAGVALELKKLGHPDGVHLFGLKERNYESVSNLGLGRIMKIHKDKELSSGDKALHHVPSGREVPSEDERAKMMLKAHEDLVQADKSNYHKFQDVIQFLKKHTPS